MTTTAEVIPVTIAPASTMKCDRCGAQGWVEVELLSGFVLAFCGHHYVNQKEALTLKAKRIIDHLPHLEAQEARRNQPEPTK